MEKCGKKMLAVLTIYSESVLKTICLLAGN